jgi:hypothetical protein
MAVKIERPADTPVEVYDFWHRRWCEILTADHREALLDAGLAGSCFTERVPDAPDGKGYFSYAISGDGRVDFMEGEGEAVAEYESYELGFRMLSDARFDNQRQIEEGRFRILSEPERWAALMGLLPILREACHRAIEEAEEEFGVELPKSW